MPLARTFRVCCVLMAGPYWKARPLTWWYSKCPRTLYRQKRNISAGLSKKLKSGEPAMSRMIVLQLSREAVA
jgi:hypothetical protein